LILVDTDVLIDAIRGNRGAKNIMNDLYDVEDLAISAITMMELIAGCENKRELRHVEELCSWFQVVRVNEAISDYAVDLLRRYRLSHGLSLEDALIATSAIVENLPLLSKNQKHYRFIPSLMLLPYSN
jgi:predicted nucleic acid-binding protein